VATRTLVQRLGTLRRCVPALRTGSREAVMVEERLYVYRRGEAALVLLSSDPEARTVVVPGVLAAGEYVDALTNEPVLFTADGAQVQLGPRQSRVLVRADGGCAG
jgi:hypothetical protein